VRDKGSTWKKLNFRRGVTAQLIVPERKPCEGVIISQGGFAGGWILYVKSGRLTYCYNYAGLEKYVISSTQPLSSGTHQVRMESAYDGGGVAKGGTVTLYIDGSAVGSGRVERTLAMWLTTRPSQCFSARVPAIHLSISERGKRQPSHSGDRMGRSDDGSSGNA
jgi:hypothetical protein